MIVSATLESHISGSVKHDYYLHMSTRIVKDMTLDQRKRFLDICQTERDAEESPDAVKIYDLYQSLIDLRTEAFPESDLEEMTKRISSKPVYRSFISMVIRNEAIGIYGGAEEAIVAGFSKEINSSQDERPDSFMSYQVLDFENFVPAQYSMYYQPIPWWTASAKTFCTRFAARLDRMGILYPQVQRKKNMSWETCRNLWNDGYRDGDRNWTDFRTLDLELHKMKTGREIGGDCEMRKAWKFNELKPRFYYCIGGTSYWKSRHMKNIAVGMMECTESSSLLRRRYPEDVAYCISPDDYVCIWDMFSFTTQLSELKYFLYYVGKQLEDDARIQQKPMQLLDYCEGIIEITADKLILEYNQLVNERSPYSITRLAEEILGEKVEEKLEQKNSGMLGVHANIGFSTGFHGFHLECGSIKGSGCSEGDDALSGLKEDPRLRYIKHLNLIGKVHPEKVTILEPLTLEEPVQVAKFIKRRLTRSYDGITMNYLASFPSLADVFEIEDGFHTSRRKETSKVIGKFVGQVGAFFWELHASHMLDEDEYMLIDRVLGHCYKRLRLRQSGSLPGIQHPAFDGYMPFAVPPLRFRYDQEDWSEYLWDNTNESYCVLPQDLGPISIPPYEEDLVFDATEGALLNILEDIGCVEKRGIRTEMVATSFGNRRLFRSFLSGQRRSFRCKYLDFCPPWFDRVFSDYQACPFVQV